MTKAIPFGIAAWWLSDIVVKCVFASTNCSNSSDCQMAPVITITDKTCNSTRYSQGPMIFSVLIVQSALPYFSRKGINYVSALILCSPCFTCDSCHIKLAAWHNFYEHYVTAGFEGQFPMHLQVQFKGSKELLWPLPTFARICDCSTRCNVHSFSFQHRKNTFLLHFPTPF